MHIYLQKDTRIHSFLFLNSLLLPKPLKYKSPMQSLDCSIWNVKVTFYEAQTHIWRAKKLFILLKFYTAELVVAVIFRASFALCRYA